MDWWVLELFANALLVGDRPVAGAVHQAIRQELRGRRLPGQPPDRQELHRPHRHRLLPDLLLLHAVHGELPAQGAWGQTVGGAQLQHEVARIGGILLILGILHGLNLIALPVMGRLLTMNRRLDQDTPSVPVAPAPPGIADRNPAGLRPASP